MPAMTVHPILNLSETYIRQTIYDNLSADVREKIDIEKFRDFVKHDDYHFFATALSDLINDYLHESDIFTEFLGQAALETISKSENLSELYIPDTE
ncbi:MAG: hypothetical protein EAZ92_17330 [Candidatus Kapaibacterium sp.]|nr:MAG: hypothetical protein EAZ92_17330 [Candidatus Kapabacteria bacterium]